MKNIVLFSDGTGNGAAKRHHTNVWRLYSALDLHRPDQVAFFDDGVGSQEFLPLKILGGAIGFGLKRNVLELYKFLCRNYQPGDRIYLFGFSRGAFTVRVLAKMIEVCGLFTEYDKKQEPHTEQLLHTQARINYSIYRSQSNTRGLLTKPFRSIMNWLVPKKAKIEDNPKPDIEFIGVWDTVDAFGFPIDELAILWDLLIIPIRLPNLELSTKVKKACHALSIDDERHTFHPVLWDESREATLVNDGEASPNRLEQVWFSGVHSDVGGGYPRHCLSLVSLDWMISKVEALGPGGPGLVFIPQTRDEYHKQSDWHGKQHDSRAMLAAYYRYKPRNIEQLCNNLDEEVFIPRPKIHRSVLERVKGNAVPYAPTGLPSSYEIVSTQAAAPPYGTAPVLCYEKENQAQKRKEAMNRALDIVFWRRWLYAALMLTTALLVASRYYLPQAPEGFVEPVRLACLLDTTPQDVEPLGWVCLLDPFFQFAIDNVPDFAEGWFEALRHNPGWLWGFITAFTILFTLKIILWRKTQGRAMEAWAQLKGKGAPAEWDPTSTSKFRAVAHSPFRTVVKWITAGAVFVLALGITVFLLNVAIEHARSTCFPQPTSSKQLVIEKHPQ